MTEIFDEHTEDDEPYTRYSIVACYPPDRGGRYAGKTLRLRGDGSSDRIERRRTFHLDNGALWAVIEEQVWAPTDWRQTP